MRKSTYFRDKNLNKQILTYKIFMYVCLIHITSCNKALNQAV